MLGRGDGVVGPAGGLTAVITQSLCEFIEETQKSYHIKKLYGARHGVRGIIEENFIDLRLQPTQMLDLVVRTPAAALGSKRDKTDKEYWQRIFDIFRKGDVRDIFDVGGNDTAETAIIVRGLSTEDNSVHRVIFLPNTIDTD